MSKRSTKRKPSEALLARIPDEKERTARRRGVSTARLRLELAQLVHTLREGAGLSQFELAELVGTRQPTISRLENGEHVALPSLGLLGRVAEALDARLEVRIVRNRNRSKRKTATKAGARRGRRE